MTLPFDTARCFGTDHPDCDNCRRKEPGHPTHQWYTVPPDNLKLGESCESQIPRIRDIPKSKKGKARLVG